MLTMRKQVLAFLFASLVVDRTVAITSDSTSIGSSARRNLDESDIYTTYKAKARCGVIAMPDIGQGYVASIG